MDARGAGSPPLRPRRLRAGIGRDAAPEPLWQDVRRAPSGAGSIDRGPALASPGGLLRVGAGVDDLAAAARWRIPDRGPALGREGPGAPGGDSVLRGGRPVHAAPGACDGG